jgi:hypothetical protein
MFLTHPVQYVFSVPYSSIPISELERGLFDENWRIRHSSVQLLGELKTCEKVSLNRFCCNILEDVCDGSTKTAHPFLQIPYNVFIFLKYTQ